MEDEITIYYAEDKVPFRNAVIRGLRDYDISTIGVASNGKELLDLLKTGVPQVILLDLEMPVMDGNKALDLIMERYPEANVIVVSLHAESVLVDDYMRRGARGYIPKDIMVDFEILNDGIRAVVKGETYVRYPQDAGPDFTYHQARMIPLICDGKTNEEIAKDLGTTLRSVEKVRHRIYEKTNSNTAAEFFRYAFRKGLDFLGRG